MLITGDTGGLGAQLARHVAGLGGEQVLLLSRRGMDGEGAAALREELTAQGAEVSIQAL